MEALAFASGDRAWDNAFFRHCWGFSKQAELGLAAVFLTLPTRAIAGQQPISTI
jgi:hypothetical protein